MGEREITQIGLMALKHYTEDVINSDYYDYRDDPWWGYKGEEEMGDREKNLFSILLLDTQDLSHDLRMKNEELKSKYNISFSSIKEAKRMMDELFVISTSAIFVPQFLSKSYLKEYLYSLSDLERISLEIRKERKQILDDYSEEIFSLDKSLFSNILSNATSSSFRALKSRIGGIYKGEGKLNRDELINISKKLVNYRRQKRLYKEKEEQLGLVRSPYYLGPKTDWESFALLFRPIIETIKDKEESFGLLSSFTKEEMEENKERIFSLYSSLSASFDRYYESFLKLLSYWDSDVLNLEEVSLERLEYLTQKAYEKSQGKEIWKEVIPIIKECEKDGVLDYLNSSLDNHHTKERIIDDYLKKDVEAPEKEESCEENEIVEDKEELFPLYEYFPIDEEAKVMGVSTFSSPNFPELMEKILIKESPILERDLVKRLLFLSGSEYLNKDVFEEYKKATEPLENVLFISKGGFLYRIGQENFSFRRSEMLRDFSHIAPEELGSLMLAIIKANSPITKGELYNKIGQYCGYTTVLKARYPELDRILLLLSDKVKIDDDKIYWEEER